MLTRAMLQAIVASTLPQMGFKADANETLAFTRQLEHVITAAIDYEYPESVGRKVIPINASGDPGAESYVYRMFDDVGEADLIESYADDLPLVDAYGTEHTAKISPYGVAFFYSVQDLRRSRLLDIPIDTKKATGARKAVERKLDALLAIGDSRVSMTGVANNANVGLVAPVTGTWATATAAQIQADVEKLCKAIFDNTKGIHGNPENGSKLTLLVGSAQYSKLMTTRVDSFNMITLLEYLKTHLPAIDSIQPWARLDLADAEGDGPRIVAMHKDSDVIEGVLPLDFTPTAPQARNLGWYTPCEMRFGGVKIVRPKAMAYMDGC